MEPVGELDEDDPDVLRHRQEHLADVLGLPLLVRVRGELRELRYAVDELGDLGAEALLDVGQAVLGVLGHVVEKGGGDGGRVQAQLRERQRRRDGMGDVGLAGRARLAVVRDDREIEGPGDGLDVGAGRMLGDCFEQLAAQDRQRAVVAAYRGAPGRAGAAPSGVRPRWARGREAARGTSVGRE